LGSILSWAAGKARGIIIIIIMTSAVNPKKRKLPDWILYPTTTHNREEKEEEDDNYDKEARMLENTRKAIQDLEENKWKKDWGEWYSEEEDELFDLSQSPVLDHMTAEDVLEIICNVRGIAYTISTYPFVDDREALVNDLRSCLAKYCVDRQIPYFE